MQFYLGNLTLFPSILTISRFITNSTWKLVCERSFDKLIITRVLNQSFFLFKFSENPFILVRVEGFGCQKVCGAQEAPISIVTSSPKTPWIVRQKSIEILGLPGLQMSRVV